MLAGGLRCFSVIPLSSLLIAAVIVDGFHLSNFFFFSRMKFRCCDREMAGKGLSGELSPSIGNLTHLQSLCGTISFFFIFTSLVLYLVFSFSYMMKSRLAPIVRN